MIKLHLGIVFKILQPSLYYVFVILISLIFLREFIHIIMLTEKLTPSWDYESRLWSQGFSPVAGIDEAGRGALAGPVVAAAVILPYSESYPYIDSKLLSEKKRESYAEEIKETALAWGVGIADSQEIDNYNIIRATHMAASRAIRQCAEKLEPTGLVTDYLNLEGNFAVLAPAKADQLSFQVAAASILAKTTRDALMVKLADQYGDYGFQRNKGYGTKLHIKAVEKNDPCRVHRKSFKPISTMLQNKLFT